MPIGQSFKSKAHCWEPKFLLCLGARGLRAALDICYSRTWYLGVGLFAGHKTWETVNSKVNLIIETRFKFLWILIYHNYNPFKLPGKTVHQRSRN